MRRSILADGISLYSFLIDKLLIGSLLVLCTFGTVAAWAAEERILNYDVEIDIAHDASMEVREAIEVIAAGQQIRRGIYRDFPTDYEDKLGNSIRVDFDVISVTRNGEPDDFRTERLSNGVRVYVGNADVFLTPGRYRYVISYRTDRQLGYFEEHDELYWNVTGNGWGFAIDHVTATVELPQRVPQADIATYGYTGRAGTSGTDYTARAVDGGAHFATTRSLPPGHGMTIVVGWPKGIVAQPSTLQRVWFLLKDNASLLLSGGAFFGSLGYLLFVWRRFGRDPEPGVIYPRYEPPEGYSPASSRYIAQMGYDPETLSAAIVSLAVKGHLEIQQDDSDDYVLKRVTAQTTLAPGEERLLASLFSNGDVLELDNKNHEVLQVARLAHKRSLRTDYLHTYFRKNRGLLLPSIALSGLAVVIAANIGMTFVAMLFVAANAILHLGFMYLMKAPTARGRWLLDQLDGFKLYLNVSGQEDLGLHEAPQKTPELFERYLPYAIALGVEKGWARQFTAVFEALSRERGREYRPSWYRGRFHHSDLTRFSSNVGANFSSAISSAATPPGSSSGGGGGGSSGGGGGGGGGGGW